MFKVLIAADGSPTSRAALEFARKLLVDRQTAVTILHIIPLHFTYGRAGAAPTETYDMREVQASSSALLAESSQYLREAGVGPSIETRLEMGDPADLLLNIAEESDVDLIILGSRGLGAARRFLIGSVSTRVATHAHCAVLVVHPKMTDEPSSIAQERGG